MTGTAATSPRSRGWFALAALALVALFAWLTLRDIGLETRRVEGLMLGQARSIASLVSESAIHGNDTYRLWEDEVASRLLDNARWVARADSAHSLTSADLARIARLHRVSRINLFDASGTKIASSVIEAEDDSTLTPRHDPRDFIGPVLRRETRELRIGFKPARFRGGSRFAVAVARSRGGAIVVNVFADSMRTVLESMQPAHLLATLGRASGVRFVVLQRGDSMLVDPALERNGSLPAADPELAALRAGSAAEAREHLVDGRRVYEVASPLELPGYGDVVLRVGLDATPLEQARRGVRDRALSRAMVMLLFALLASIVVMVGQRRAVLAAEVARVRAELEARELEAMRTAKLAAMGELAAHVAHEIRNPLNTIHMIAQQAERLSGGNERMRASASDMRAESQRIETIIQQFLDFARPRTPDHQPLDLREIVTVAGRTAAPAFEAAGVELRVDAEHVRALLDPVLLSQILDNLLRNAREASPPGGRVTLSVRRDGPEVRIAVEDQGPGVPAELRERIFDLYFSTKPGGSGLGLSLVSQMAAALGGGVRVEDAPGSGARFVVRLPMEPS